MKKLLCILTILSCRAGAQKIKEGTIRFTVNIWSVAPNKQRPVMTENVIYFKPGKVLSETSSPLLKMKILKDESGMLILMDAAAGAFKTFSRKSKAELKNREGKKNRIKDLQINYTQQKKKILGYDCSEALITFTDPKGMKNQVTVWYTDQINNFETPGTAGAINPTLLIHLKGMPLEMDVKNANITGKMVVKDISTKPVPDVMFTLSTVGYKEMKLKDPKKLPVRL